MRSHRTTTIGTIAATAALLLGACSSDDDPESVSTTSSPPSTEMETTETSAMMSEDTMADEEAAPSEEDPAVDDKPSIPEVAASDGRFTTLLAAVEAAGLAETLSGDGPFTVFAPTDDAFAALPEGTVDSLLADPEGALTDVLLAHVVEGSVTAADVVGLSEVTTINGTVLPVVVEGESVSIGGSMVMITDIEASNGIIHVIDAVIVP